jgi:hypothetical protein
VGEWLKCDHRRHVDDRSAPIAEHLWQDLVCQPHDRIDVQSDAADLIRERRGVKVTGGGDPCVVHQQGDRRELAKSPDQR